MAHAMNAEHLEQCFTELQAADVDDHDHRQLSLVVRTMKYGGPAVREFSHRHGAELVERLFSALSTNNGRFGDFERELIDYTLLAAEVLHDLIKADRIPVRLFGEPRAAGWALARCLGVELDGRPPDSYWWRTVYAEAHAIVAREQALDAIIDQTCGAGDASERMLAIHALDGSVIDLLVSPDRWIRRLFPRSASPAPVPQQIHFLTDDEAMRRAEAWEVVAAVVVDEAVRLSLERAVLRQDPDPGVHAAVAETPRSNMRSRDDLLKVFRKLLVRHDRISGNEQRLFSSLLQQFYEAEEVQADLETFVREGWAWFCSDEDWKLLMAREAYRNAIQQRLRSDEPWLHDVRAAKFAQDLQDDIRDLLGRLATDGRHPFLVAQCLSYLPSDWQTTGTPLFAGLHTKSFCDGRTATNFMATSSGAGHCWRLTTKRNGYSGANMRRHRK
jgi:hypothetical protein